MVYGVLINIKNEVIIPCKYNNIFINNFEKEILIIVKDENHLWGLVNAKK